MWVSAGHQEKGTAKPRTEVQDKDAAEEVGAAWREDSEPGARAMDAPDQRPVPGPPHTRKCVPVTPTQVLS